MKTFLTLTIVQTISLFSYGFILPLDLILEKNVATSGNQIFSVEQDVFLKEGMREVAIHESWQVEGDKNLRLTATGLGELKDVVKIVAIYNGKTRTSMIGKNRVTHPAPVDFFEKFLSVRSVHSFKTYLNELSIDPSVRFSRADGSITYAIGQASPVGSLKPQMWFQQDNFQVRKIRFPSEAEATFSDFAEVSPKLIYPKMKKIEWSGKTAIIKVKSIVDKTKIPISNFYPQNVETPSELLVSNKNTMGALIEDFYTRFR
jgi:hypothetical protein